MSHVTSHQHFPLSLDVAVDSVAYVPGDSLTFQGMFGGVAEPWWISSDGVGSTSTSLVTVTDFKPYP